MSVQTGGIYRYSLRTLVVSGIPWDVTRLLVGIPLLLVSLLLHLRRSLRGTVLLVGSLASFFYQYLLWTFDWAYNPLFLAYVALFSLSLSTLVLVLAELDPVRVRAAIGARFPVKTAAGFSVAVGGLLVLKCLAEVLPGIAEGRLPVAATGFYTLVDQALDLGLVAPFCIVSALLLLRRHSLGYVLASSAPIIFISIGVSVVAGEIMLGLTTGRMNGIGIAIFSTFIASALALLVTALANIRSGAAPAAAALASK